VANPVSSDHRNSILSHSLSSPIPNPCYIPGGVNRPSAASHPPSAKMIVPVT
jgi:hypothetical protein